MIALTRPDLKGIVRVPAADSDYRVALAWVNDLRRFGGAGPLMAMRPGFLGDEIACPIAASLKDVFPRVLTGAQHTKLDHTCKADQHLAARLPHPPQVRRFIYRVDLDRFPSLVLPTA